MFEIVSPAFASGARMAPKYATRKVAGGQNVSIPYRWTGAPAGTRSFTLLLVDRAPIARNWVHWLVIGIPGGVDSLAEGASLTPAMPSGARELTNSFGATGYGGPQPPPGSGDHRYEAVLYALDVEHLGVPETATLADVESAMKGHVLGQAVYSGTFSQ